MTATALPSQQTATRSRGGTFSNALGKLKKLFFPVAPTYLLMVIPAILLFTFFAFLQSWNDFMMPQLITANPKWQTLPVIQYLFQDQFTTNFNVAFASYLMALLPTLVVFLIAQRWVVSGIMRGSIK